MKHLKKYRYISCGIAKSTDKISDFRLIGRNQLFPEERVVIRVIIPDDLKLSKYSCDNYSTTKDSRTLEELGCDNILTFDNFSINIKQGQNIKEPTIIIPRLEEK